MLTYIILISTTAFTIHIVYKMIRSFLAQPTISDSDPKSSKVSTRVITGVLIGYAVCFIASVLFYSPLPGDIDGDTANIFVYLCCGNIGAVLGSIVGLFTFPQKQSSDCVEASKKTTE